jgi:outer membrane receptor protein involved in Fe transport
MYTGGLSNTTLMHAGEGYQQLTFFVGNKLHVSDTINVDYSFSYDTLDFERAHSLYTEPSRHRQDEYHAKAILHWQPHENHSIAVGGEYSHEEFGLTSPGWPYGKDADSDAFGLSDGTGMPRWSTDTSSVLGEYQWKVSDKWTLFTGGRVDWNRFIKKEEMFSPRAAVVYTPTEQDTLKFIVQRAVRASTAESMKKTMDDLDEKSDSETMDYYEIRWERQQDEHLWLAASGYFTSNDAVAWSVDQVAPLGQIDIYGAEIEATYKTEKAKFTFSHGYSKLVDMDLATDDTGQLLTAEPYGYGHDLANWHNHVTKLTGNYELTEKLSLNGSLNVYWGIPGRKDMAEKAGESIAGFDDPYQENIYLNLGMNYKVSKNLNVRATAHNILGWFDKKYNKRNCAFASQEGGFLTEAPSFSFSLKYIF